MLFSLVNQTSETVHSDTLYTNTFKVLNQPKYVNFEFTAVSFDDISADQMSSRFTDLNDDNLINTDIFGCDYCSCLFSDNPLTSIVSFLSCTALETEENSVLYQIKLPSKNGDFYITLASSDDGYIDENLIYALDDIDQETIGTCTAFGAAVDDISLDYLSMTDTSIDEEELNDQREYALSYRAEYTPEQLELVDRFAREYSPVFSTSNVTLIALVDAV